MINLEAYNTKTNEVEITCCRQRKCWNFRQTKKAYKKCIQRNRFISDWKNTKHIRLKWLNFNAKYVRAFKNVLHRLIKDKYL
ncbi:hypothetical protein A6A20_01915 [Volucribacter amazonae]|uniref:Uncharacterized protein n=1 Tax=Volucribacter amazonae TaxID=256731 RepID=A0A9X4P9X3_9PAST|nr:hypothetical protein [Volucribacter amazonae]